MDVFQIGRSLWNQIRVFWIQHWMFDNQQNSNSAAPLKVSEFKGSLNMSSVKSAKNGFDPNSLEPKLQRSVPETHVVLDSPSRGSASVGTSIHVSYISGDRIRGFQNKLSRIFFESNLSFSKFHFYSGSGKSSKT